jgi:hypothetical protein
MVPGYLQVCSRTHTVSAAEMIGDAAIEFDAIVDVVQKVFLAVYHTRGVVFEHGKAGACMWRSGDPESLRDLCHHAHVHLVPREVNLLPLIEAVAPSRIRVQQWDDVRTLRREFLGAGSYLYYADTLGDAFLFPIRDVRALPPQFLRTCLAAALGQPEAADWRQWTGASFFNTTRREIVGPIVRELQSRGAQVVQGEDEVLQWRL